MRQWMVAAKKADFYAIAEKFHVDPVVARIIRNREVIGEKNIRIYLGGNLSDLSDPHQMKDMDRLVEILAQKIRKQVRIRIIGDYDVDGVTSSHLFLTALRRVGAKVDVVIPHRIQDGYGLSLHLLQQAKEDGVDTILTCDNGIAAIDEIAWAKAQKMTVLVTDHHAVPFEEHEGRRTEKKSLADAVVNPHQQDCGYPYKELCGAGVAWNVIRVLYENYDMDKREAEDLLDFVAMATVCDVMSLTGENRILVKEGLKRIRHTKNIGLQALMQACNVQPENISAYHFGYVLGPCVNATGRLDTARHALRLFETGQETEAEEIARDLVDLNQERKELTLQGVEMAKKLCEEGGYENDPVLVLFLPDVHESIAGLIAGRIREMYNRPVFVLTRGEEGVKGSGRSTENYSMYENMCGCAELFTKFGGHPMAAGLSLPTENIDLFRAKLNRQQTLTEKELTPVTWIDVPMPVSYASKKLVEQLRVLEPFGKGNEKPVFADRKLTVRSANMIGKNKNVLKMQLEDTQGHVVDAIQFKVEEEDMPLRGKEISIVYYPDINEFRGNQTLQFIVQEWCYTT
mgnify:CR=1 FL=1